MKEEYYLLYQHRVELLKILLKRRNIMDVSQRQIPEFEMKKSLGHCVSRTKFVGKIKDAIHPTLPLYMFFDTFARLVHGHLLPQILKHLDFSDLCVKWP